MLTRRRKIALVVVAMLLFGAALVILHRSPEANEPSAWGHSLTEWALTEHADPQWIPPRTGSGPVHTYAAAVREMGTNTIPYLLQWIQYEPPAWETKVEQFSERFIRWRPFAHHLALAQSRADFASFAFRTLGPEAYSSIPELIRLMTNSTGRTAPFHVASALAGMGKSALPSLIPILTNSPPAARHMAFYAVSHMGTNALPAMPILLQCLGDKQENVVAGAIAALGELRLQPDLVVPALTNFLVGSRKWPRVNAVFALEKFGPPARPAVPHLLALLTDSDPLVRTMSTNALHEIAPETVSNPARLPFAPTIYLNLPFGPEAQPR